MTNVKAAFKALSPRQQDIVTQRWAAGSASPDEWLALLGPVAEFDRLAEASSQSGGFFERRRARKHDVPDELRDFALPLVSVLREDHDPDAQLELKIDMTGFDHKDKLARTGNPYNQGAYHTIVDSFYADPWLEGTAKFVDGATVKFSAIDHVRSSRKTKRSASGRTKIKVKRKKKIEFAVTVTLPARNYAVAEAPHSTPVPGIKKASVDPKDEKTIVSLSRVLYPPEFDSLPTLEMMLDLIGAAYGQVDPARRKKL